MLLLMMSLLFFIFTPFPTTIKIQKIKLKEIRRDVSLGVVVWVLCGGQGRENERTRNTDSLCAIRGGCVHTYPSSVIEVKGGEGFPKSFRK